MKRKQPPASLGESAAQPSKLMVLADGKRPAKAGQRKHEQSDREEEALYNLLQDEENRVRNLAQKLDDLQENDKWLDRVQALVRARAENGERKRSLV